jgi:G3E family GTPase
MKPRYVMVGGFLGAGKTTALLRLAKHFRSLGKRVGLITNDQSIGLVDTTMLQHHDFPVEEITGGCFCCRFNTLTEAAQKLSETDTPEVFLAEPVGSCTDLTATVSYPLRRLYGQDFTIAPYTVLIDPTRAERILGLATGKNFSTKVLYIYRKQLEEADIIGINKCETLDDNRLSLLKSALQKEFPLAVVLTFSARTGQGFEDWTPILERDEQQTHATMTVDYDTYAEGEALLGWLNLTARVSGSEIDGNALVLRLLEEIQQLCGSDQIELAHLKATLTPDNGNDLAIANLTRTDGEAELSHSLDDTLTAGELIVNLRAEADPESLRFLVTAVLQRQPGVTIFIQHLEAFRPGKPVPTHRDVVGVS